MVTIAGSTKSSFLQKKILRNNFYVKKIKKKEKIINMVDYLNL